MPCIICVVLLLVAVAVIAILLLRLRRSGGVILTRAPPASDPKVMDSPNPSVVEGELAAEPGLLKYILLIAGAQPAHMIIREKPGGYELVYAPQGGSPFDPGGEYAPTKNIRDAWVSCLRRYSDKPFKDDGWQLVAIRPFSKADIDHALDAISAKKPKALVVHYVGHGSWDATGGPFVTLTGKKTTAIQVTKKSDKTRTIITTEIPDENMRVNGYYTKQLADKLKTAAVFAADIPKTLIVDGCELAGTVDSADAANKFHIVTAVSISRQETIWCRFTELWGATDKVKPACFESFGGDMDAAVKAVNDVIGDALTAVNDTGAREKQRAKWK
jgi:hypothetical protein